MSKKNILSIIGVLLIIAAATTELAMLTWWKNYFGSHQSPMVLLGSGLITGIGFLIFFYGKPVYRNDGKINLATRQLQYQKIIPALLILIFGIQYCGKLLGEQVENFPIDFYNPEGSDVIPQIGIMIDRFLKGVFPYQMISEWTFTHSLYPTYLPMTWMPFIIPDILHLDYRWFAFGVLCLGIIWLLAKVVSWNPNYLVLLILGAIPFFFLNALQHYDDEGTFRYSIETLISGYYLMLAMSLLSTSNLLRGVVLLLCLLSRYSVVLWVPLFLLVLFFKEKKKNIISILGIIAAGFILFYFIPFFSQDTSIFMRGYDYHSDGAIQAWKLMPWQEAGEMPFRLYKGLGFSWLYYENYAGDLVDKVDAYRFLHLVLSTSCIAVLSLLFFKIKDKIDYRIFLLGSLKIYMVIFYNFIQIPFGYLFMVSIFISLPMLALLLMYPSLQTEES